MFNCLMDNTNNGYDVPNRDIVDKFLPMKNYSQVSDDIKAWIAP